MALCFTARSLRPHRMTAVAGSSGGRKAWGGRLRDTSGRPAGVARPATKMMAVDFTKAFLYGDMERDVFIELPDEDERKYRGE